MALSCSSTILLNSPSSSSFPLFQIHPNSFRPFRLNNISCNCSYQTLDVDNQTPHNPKLVSTPIPIKKKTKQKPKPSFYQQVREKWSLRNDSQRQKFPWQEQEVEDEQQLSDEDSESSLHSNSVSIPPKDSVFNSNEENGETPLLSKHFSSPPWINRSNFKNPQSEISQKDPIFNGDEVSEVNGENGESSFLGDDVKTPPWVNRNNVENPHFDYNADDGVDTSGEQRIGRSKFKSPHFNSIPAVSQNSSFVYGGGVSELSEKSRGLSNADAQFDSYNVLEENNSHLDGDEGNEDFEDELRDDESSGSFQEVNDSTQELVDDDDDDDDSSQDIISFLSSRRKSDSVELPWESKSDLESRDSKWRKGKAELAEKTIPDSELRRLRNISLRMQERIKVRAAGVTQALVDRIHEKWKEEEVVKLKFEGPPAFNMKRTHETLESRTGGVVIWRSGSSLVLYRGMTYNLPCVQQYTKLTHSNTDAPNLSKNLITGDRENIGLRGAAKTQLSPNTRATNSIEKTSKEMMDLYDLNMLLDELGPRFIDWSGPEPLPVDADLLPSVVPGYTPPFRVLPYRVRAVLRDEQTTSYRRLARTSPPHFALGRNRELQGLARAMVKLWERNAIAKIAIKRGVLNTSNERMAEELKKLTGGTLLSRNKDFIVFYRGNDFLSPPVTEALLERQKLVEVHQIEEEIARDRASTMLSKAKVANGLSVAGTLAETLAAKARWGKEPSSEDLEKMKKDFALARHASLVRYLEKKLARAQDKVNRAENALRKVQEFLTPTDLPSDLETITDEERMLFRKMGLGMKPFLLVGRREVFDGTVENMHMHWKYRELVKIIVRGRNFLQVKHMAISLEAESGGLLVSVDKTTKGYAIIVYRGKNYQRPQAMRPKSLLTKRQALARSIELQRREALIHHIMDVRKRIKLLKSGLDHIESGKEADEELHSKLNDAYNSDDDFEEDEGEEAYLGTYEDDDEDDRQPANELN